MTKIKDLEGKELKFEIDNEEIMNFYQETDFVILMNKEGKSKVLVLLKEEKQEE